MAKGRLCPIKDVYQEMFRDYPDTQYLCYAASASVFSDDFAAVREIEKMGRPKISAEEKLAHRRTWDRERSAAKALAAGREPGRVGAPPKNRTEDELRDMRRVKQAKWRAANLEKSREMVRESMRRKAAERAVAEGRIPGKKGPAKQFTEAEQRAKRKAKTERWNELNKDKYLEKARIREQAKRDGTFVSRAKKRLTAEEKRLVQVTESANRRARVRNAGGRHTKDDIIRLMAEQEGKCAICALLLDPTDYHVDHWIPLAKGGTNGSDNIKLTHPACNLKKAAKLPDDLQLLGESP